MGEGLKRAFAAAKASREKIALPLWYKYRSPLGYEYWSISPPSEIADKCIAEKRSIKEPKN